jgi:hypothetical protein
MMDFIGSYKVDSLVTPLRCGCTFIVGSDWASPDNDVLLARIQFPGWPTSVIQFYWFEAGLEYQDWHVPPALVLMHEVAIK